MNGREPAQSGPPAGDAREMTVTTARLKDVNFLAGLALACLSIYILHTASRWTLFNAEGPGPGFFPMGYGLIMLGCSLVLIYQRITAPVDTRPKVARTALDESGFKLLQARPLRVAPAHVPDEIWLKHPGLNGHPAGVGWGSGRAVVVNCECELARVAPGDILITRVAGPALNHILSQVGGVVAELGGSTSHLAALGRERGIPMVLGVLDATRRIPDGAQVAVDGVAGVVRWFA